MRGRVRLRRVEAHRWDAACAHGLTQLVLVERLVRVRARLRLGLRGRG